MPINALVWKNEQTNLRPVTLGNAYNVSEALNAERCCKVVDYFPELPTAGVQGCAGRRTERCHKLGCLMKFVKHISKGVTG